MSLEQTMHLVDIDTLERSVDELRARYADADPFPHVVIDHVLSSEAFAQVAAEFPPVDDPVWKGYLHVNETKYSNTQPETWGPSLQALARELCSDRFVSFLAALTGIEGLEADWSMDGGGLHQTLRGGHLNVHTDFTTHHQRTTWVRRVNILLYLNEEWPEEWGGALELWDREMSACRARVLPTGNRMLIFTTSADSFHGHPDGLTCPPGVARRSLALYYFTEDANPVRRATNYRARPGDGRKRIAIWADRQAVDLYDRLKVRTGISDDTVYRLLGAINRLRRR
jgi:hypothetical protein